MLCSLNQLKDELRIANAETSLDSILTQAIVDASATCESAIDRVLGQAGYSNEVYDGGGARRLALRQWPIDPASTFQLKRANQWGDLAIYDASDYSLAAETGIVTLLGGIVFPSNPGSVRATYTAGYAVIGTGDDARTGVPADLAERTRTYAKLLYRKDTITVKDFEDMKEAIESYWRGYARVF